MIMEDGRFRTESETSICNFACNFGLIWSRADRRHVIQNVLLASRVELQNADHGAPVSGHKSCDRVP